MSKKFTGNDMVTPFHGEMMECYVCHKKKRSNPHVESGWTTMTFEDNLRLYFCPKCFKEVLKLQGKS